MLATIVSPRNSSRQALRVAASRRARRRRRTRIFSSSASTLQVGVGIAQRLGDRDLVHVREDAGAAVAHGLQRIGRRGDDDVAGQHRVGLLRVDAHLVQRRRVVGQAHERQHRAALLREAHEVEHAGRLAFEVRGHRDQRADRDDAGAADAGDEQVVRAGPGVRRRQRQRVDVLRRSASRAAPASAPGASCRPAADDADEARAEALGARVVLVAARLVDLALAAELGLERQHRDAVRLHRAVAAAFADRAR